MAKEWDNRRKFHAVSIVSGSEAAALREKGASIFPSRRVHTNKSEHSPSLPLLAKSRLVAVGCCEDVRAARTRRRPPCSSST
eukprot:13786150-Alexandrium_andersonii.AAC.1